MTVEQVYGGKVRVRVMGICIKNEKILLVKHKNIGNPYFWSPVGGGVEFGETLEQALKREFLEEAGLGISVKRFLFVNEFIGEKLHALEFFFEVDALHENIIKGYNPEIDIIEEVVWLSWHEIQSENEDCKHKIFSAVHRLSAIFEIQGLL